MVCFPVNDKKEATVFVPNRKSEYRATRTQGYDPNSMYYNNKKSKSRGESPLPGKLAGAAGDWQFSLHYILTLCLVYVTVFVVRS